MRSVLRSLAFLLGILSSVVLVVAQGACPDIVGDAIDVLDENCAAIGRNQACYGNGDINALDFSGEKLDSFTNRGDISEISEISNLTLSGLDEELGLWGVAVLSVQADIPDTLPGQNVMVVLFGETSLKTMEDDASSFIFSGGIGNTSCNEAPDGLLIQTPEGVGQIHLSLNNIEIELGSTAYVTAEAGGKFTFALLEGNSTLKTAESEVTLTGSEYTSIELDKNLQPVGEFVEPAPIENNLELPQLPLQALRRDISEASSSGEHILPRKGNWTYTAVEVLSGACPDYLTNMVVGTMALGNEVALDFGGEDWDFETFMRSATPENTGAQALEGTYSSPEPNVYIFSSNDPEAPFVFGMSVISETYITGYYYIDARDFLADCEITINFEVIWSE